MFVYPTYTDRQCQLTFGKRAVRYGDLLQALCRVGAPERADDLWWEGDEPLCGAKLQHPGVKAELNDNPARGLHTWPSRGAGLLHSYLVCGSLDALVLRNSEGDRDRHQLSTVEHSIVRFQLLFPGQALRFLLGLLSYTRKQVGITLPACKLSGTSRHIDCIARSLHAACACQLEYLLEPLQPTLFLPRFCPLSCPLLHQPWQVV